MLKLLKCKDPVCPDFSMVSLTRNLGKLREVCLSGAQRGGVLSACEGL